MNDDELLPIGRFARISGLSIHALRHYDDVGLLEPAEFDPSTGDRLYHHTQVREARLISALRWIDLPIDEIRQVVESTDGASAQEVLTRHREQLERRQSLVAAQLGDVDRYLEEGIAMPTVQSGCRPVQIKIAVDDAATAIRFYQEAFGLRWDVIRRTDEENYSSFMFGAYGEDAFFLLHLLDDPEELDRPGPSTFGLSVEDLDLYHARALAAGATEAVPPRNPQGMPGCSAVKDPSGNWIWLYQG